MSGTQNLLLQFCIEFVDLLSRHEDIDSRNADVDHGKDKHEAYGILPIYST